MINPVFKTELPWMLCSSASIALVEECVIPGDDTMLVISLAFKNSSCIF